MSIFITASTSSSAMFSERLPWVKHCLIKPLIFLLAEKHYEILGYEPNKIAILISVCSVSYIINCFSLTDERFVTDMQGKIEIAQDD